MLDKQPEAEIVYQDDYLFVLNKQPDCHSVIGDRNPENSVAFWLQSHFPGQVRIGKSPADCGLIQRLDFGTRGLMIAARNQQCWDLLFSDLRNGLINKYYHCLLEGKLEKKKIEVSGYIGSPYRSSMKMRFYKDKPSPKERALPSETIFELLEYYPEQNSSLVKAIANTARRHQVRLHAKVINHPLCGDKLYNPGLGIDASSFYLQASYLSFKHPVTRQKMQFSLVPL